MGKHKQGYVGKYVTRKSFISFKFQGGEWHVK